MQQGGLGANPNIVIGSLVVVILPYWRLPHLTHLNSCYGAIHDVTGPEISPDKRATSMKYFFLNTYRQIIFCYFCFPNYFLWKKSSGIKHKLLPLSWNALDRKRSSNQASITRNIGMQCMQKSTILFWGWASVQSLAYIAHQYHYSHTLFELLIVTSTHIKLLGLFP